LWVTAYDWDQLQTPILVSSTALPLLHQSSPAMLNNPTGVGSGGMQGI